MVKYWMGQHQGLHPNVGPLGQPCCSSPSLVLIQICRCLNTPCHPPYLPRSQAPLPPPPGSPQLVSLCLWPCCVYFFSNFASSLAFQQANRCPPTSWLNNCISHTAASLLCLGICWLKRLAHPVWPYQLQLPLLLMRSTCWWAWSISQQSSSARQGVGQQAGGFWQCKFFLAVGSGQIHRDLW